MTTNKSVLPALVLVAALAACSEMTVPDLNNPGLDELSGNPSRTAVLTAATGLLIDTRGGMGSQNGYVSVLGVFGRESYNFDPADPRFVTELLIGPLDGGSPAFGGNLWAGPYAAIRDANILQTATTNTTNLSATEKTGVIAYAQTLKALNFLYIINTRDSIGAPIAVDISPTAAPAPFATRAEVYNYIVALLDSANTALGTAGVELPVAMGPGFAGLDDPAGFRQFNRALRARVAAYLGDWAGVVTHLGNSFYNLNGSFATGAYFTFSSGSGDQLNGLYDPQARAILAHPSLTTDAQAGDLRYSGKITTISPPKTAQGHSSGIIFTVYNSSTASIPIIRNEELVLLRAEAELNLANLTAARDLLDSVRIRSGGLAAYAGAVTAPALTDELLYNRRYSLMFEGHRWIDMRRYNRLTQLPIDVAGDTRFNRMPIPTGECDPRSPQPAGCGTIVGF